jgi:hypothetical protein
MYQLYSGEMQESSYRISSIVVPPAKLVSLFGQPGSSDGERTSGEYVFQSESGEIFTLYDYKRTNLYDNGLPSPNEFWSQQIPCEFSIGGTYGQDINNFVQWMESKIK